MTTHQSVLQGHLPQAVSFITQTAQAILPASHCHVWQLQGDALHIFPEDLQPALPLKLIPLDKYPWLRHCLSSVRAINCLDSVSSDAEKTITLALLKTNRSISSLWAPILVSGRCWGILAFGSTANREWQPLERNFADQAANQVSHAVLNEERCRAEAEVTRSRERYRSFVEMSRELMARIEFDHPIPLHLPDSQKVDLIIKTGYIADCNDALARFFGFKHAGQIRGARIHRLAPRWGKRGVLFQLVQKDCQVINIESAIAFTAPPVGCSKAFKASSKTASWPASGAPPVTSQISNTRKRISARVKRATMPSSPIAQKALSPSII